MNFKSKVVVALCCSLFLLFSVQSQNTTIDRLTLELQNHDERDTIRVNLLNDLADSFLKKNTIRTIVYLEEAETIAEALNFTKGKARNLLIKGKVEETQSDFDEALLFAKEALQLYTALNDEPGIANCYDYIGSIFQNKGDRKEAIVNYLKAVDIKSALGNKDGISESFRLIGIAYFELGNYIKAISSYEKALEIGKEVNNEDRISRSLMNIGNVHLIQGNYPLALEYHNKSLTINEKRKDTFLISLSLSNIGHIYNNLKNYDKALIYSKKALDIQKKIGNMKRVAEILLNLGLTYSLVKDYEQAGNVFKEALTITEEIGNKHLKGFALNNIGYIYQELKEYSMSIKYYEKAIKNDLSIDGKRVLERSYYGMAKTLMYQKKYKEALYYALKSKQLAQNLNILNSERDIQELLSVIYKNTGHYKEALESHQQFKVLNDSLFNKENVQKIAQLEYEYKYKQAMDSVSIRELQLTKTVTATNLDLEKSRRKYLWAIIGVLSVSFFLGTIIFYQKFKNMKVRNENIVMEQKLLRSQMTPHFIFNSLSVLQGMILNKERKKSVSYLSTFSKLLRITLENSRDKTVLLSEEITGVENYLALQNLENESYLYSVSVANTIDPTLFKIPPMLIQPFVENAVKHAFADQKGNREIEVAIKHIHEKLTCTIIDNGIGVDSRKEGYGKDKISMATTITSERLELLAKDLKMEGSVTVENRKKYNEQGTLVTLVIPYVTLI